MALRTSGWHWGDPLVALGTYWCHGGPLGATNQGPMGVINVGAVGGPEDPLVPLGGCGYHQPGTPGCH